VPFVDLAIIHAAASSPTLAAEAEVMFGDQSSHFFPSEELTTKISRQLVKIQRTFQQDNGRVLVGDTRGTMETPSK
jgi:hypothetical protein